MINKFLLVICLSIMSTFSLAKEKCVVTKAAFDIGSGTTKMKVAEVDICKKKIIKILVERDKPVAYKESLSQGQVDFIEDSELNQGIMILNYFLKEARAAGAVQFDGVATSAFRKAKNGDDVVQKLIKSTGINLKIISQDEEAEIGFYAALTKVNHKKEDIIVWDIGGGSMQVSYLAADKIKILKGSQASVTFKEEIIEKIKGKDKSMTKSPNPIGLDNFEKINELINVDHWKEQLDVSNKVIIGIGGVHYYSIKGQLKPKHSYYEQDQVEKMAKTKMDFDDVQIGGDYAATEASNLLLVNGYMEKLGLKRVFPIKVNLTDGILVK